MTSASEVEARIADAHRVALAANLALDQTGFGDEAIVGWVVKKGNASYFDSKPGEEFKSWTTVRGELVLLPDGELWLAEYCWGMTDEKGSFHWTRGAPIGREDLVGDKGPPFHQMLEILDRFIAIRS
jgi:hypothetical protein